MRKVLILSGLLVAGCATVSQMTATGGSRADGIVKLSFEYGMFDKIQIDEVSALTTARKRCATWGYQDAEPFGGMTRQCQMYSTMGCSRWFATVEYQCISAGMAQPAAAPLPVVAGPVQPPASPAARPMPSKVKLVPARTASGYCI